MDTSPVKSVGVLAWFAGVLMEVQNILIAFPVVSFLVVGTAGAYAAGAFAIEAGSTKNGLGARFLRATFACLLLAFLWTYFQWPLPLGLVAAGIVSVYPQQMLDFARDTLKAVAAARASKKGDGP